MDSELKNPSFPWNKLTTQIGVKNSWIIIVVLLLYLWCKLVLLITVLWMIHSKSKKKPNACMLNPFSHVWLFATLWTMAHQAPLSMGFSRREYWSGLPFPSPGDLPDPGVEPGSPELLADSLPSEPLGKPTPGGTDWKQGFYWRFVGVRGRGLQSVSGNGRS